MNVRAVRKALGTDHLSQPILPWIQLGLFLIGAGFWYLATQQDSPFDVNTFGHFALEFRAEFWAIAMMGPAAITWIGLRDPVKHWMVSVGAGLQFLNFSALAYSFLWTGGNDVMGMFALVIFAPLHAYMFGAAVNDA